ncbi:hypothetical protein ABEV54_23030 [Peribacillus psychrosaccharolyticus]
MENKSCGVIKRLGYEDDRRGVCALITDKGEQRLQDILETINETLKTSLSNIDIDSALTFFMNFKAASKDE